MLKNLLMPEIRELLARRDLAELRRSLVVWPAPEIADLILDLEETERALVFRSLPRDLMSRVFSHLDFIQQDELLKALSDEEARHLLADLKPDDRTAFLEELPGRMTQRLLNLLSPEDLRETRQLLGYPEESVGRLMTPDYVAIRPEWTVGQALEHIRHHGKDSETITMVYVTDRSWRLLDAFKLRKLILADPKQKVQDLMDYSFESLSPLDDQEQAVRMIKRYDLFALPVIDSEGILLGIVTADDVLDVAEEEATEDFHKTAAVAPLEANYRGTGIRHLVQKRIGWLLALVVVNLASSGVIAAYEEMLTAAIALAFFIPLLIDSGGNTGAQSATLIVRALATGDIRLGQWRDSILKELATGAVLGVLLGAASGVLGVFRGGWEIGLVVGLAMCAIVVAANLIGMVLPFILTRLKLDPAVASSPLITSIVDAAGLLIYFFIASLILSPPA